MLKYLEVPDFHFSTKWSDTSLLCAKTVAQSSRYVDFIALPGDFFNAQIYASDKGGIKLAKQIIKTWCAVAPVIAIEGTSSHDAPGCYEIFREIRGFTLLEPGKVYGYFRDKSFDRTTVEELKDVSFLTPSAIFFGVPELNKKNIQAKLNLPASEANAQAVNYFRQYVERFIAPNRARYPDVPAIGLLHGNVSDNHRDNETNIILKASDIVIHTDDLRPANLTRWALGHIHTPWESSELNAGYAGFTGVDDNPYGKLNFVPAFNLVTDGMVERIPYGTPERKKVATIEECTDPSVAYWVETTDQDAVLPDGLHGWARLTHKQDRKETRRITSEQANNVKSLWDLFKLIDPSVSDELKALVDEITSTIVPVNGEQVDVTVTDIEVVHCKFFKGNPVRFNLEALSEGLTLIAGDNGDGKSGLLSFLTPYPVVIGKDTLSGRDSAIKDFFVDGVGSIRKTVYRNGGKHEHLITISKSKTECYLTIDGVPKLTTTSFDEMYTECIGQYGDINNYRVTSFCEQPNQASNNLTGLMSAKAIDARNVVLAIAGIDRDRERRYALDRTSELQVIADKASIQISTLESMIDNTDYTALIATKKSELADIQAECIRLSKAGRAQVALQESASKQNERTQAEQELNGLLEQVRKNELASKLKHHEAFERFEKIKELEENKRIASEFPTLQAEKANFDSIELLEHKKAMLSKPCEYCGKLPSSTKEQQAEIEKLKQAIKPITIDAFTLSVKLDEAQKAKSMVSILNSQLATMPNPSVEPIELTGEELQEARRAVYVFVDNASITTLQAKLESLPICQEVDTNAIAREVESLRAQYTQAKVREANTESELKALQAKPAEQERLMTRMANLKVDTKPLENWKYVASMLASNKIPALELDVMLDKIDEKATKALDGFQEGRYTIETVTQKEGKKGLVDKFDIVIHDQETGEECSFFIKNPGHKSFFSVAYIKALEEVRRERSRASYDPVILDETDGPIQESEIGRFYQTQERSGKTIVVSQKANAGDYMVQEINVRSLYGK